MWEHASTIVTVCSFVLASLSTVIGLTWRLSQVKGELKDAITDARDEIEERQDRHLRDVGESMAAIRQKVHEVETWARDEFVRKGSFEHILTRTERTMSDQFDKIDKRLERMEAKIDSKT
jgi:hypothetical protein